MVSYSLLNFLCITTSMPGLSMIDHQRKARLLKAAEPNRYIKKLFATTTADRRQIHLRSNTHGCELLNEKEIFNENKIAK